MIKQFYFKQFNVSTQPRDRTLLGVTTPGQSRPGRDNKEGVHCIPQSSSIAETSPSNCLESYPEHSLEESYSLCRDAAGIFYSPQLTGPTKLGVTYKTGLKSKPLPLLAHSGTDLNFSPAVLIYEALCFDVAQGQMNGAPNETRTHSCRFASLVC